MNRWQKGISKVAALIAALASIALVGLVWLVLHYSDQRIWLGIGLLMALSPFAMIWHVVRNDRLSHTKKKPEEPQ